MLRSRIQKIGLWGLLGMTLVLPIDCHSTQPVLTNSPEPTSNPTAEPTTEPLLRLETGMHTATIKRIATDAAGRWAVTASEDKTARVWEVATGRLLQVLRPRQDQEDEGKLYAVALSPDGAIVALGGWTDVDVTTSIYLFDRVSGRQLRRMSGLPNVVNHLAYSPDGRWLAASLAGQNGVRLFDATSGAEVGGDANYGGDSYSTHFSPDRRQLVTTSYDGQVRLYVVEAGRLRLLTATKLDGGKNPFAARFSPDGRTIAVAFRDNRGVVQVLDSSTLTEIARPSNTGVENGDLSSVVWSADGRFLWAGGSWDVDGKSPVRRWTVGTWTQYRDLLLANNTVMDLVPLPTGNLLFAAGDPAWGVLDGEGQVVHRQDGQLADLRGSGNELRLSDDGRQVRFGYEQWGKEAKHFDLLSRTLGADEPTLTAARTEAPGLTIEQWKNSRTPRLNGRPLQLQPYETSRSLAIAADGRSFVLGADWTLRRYDRTGQEEWQISVPGATWAVNLSGDGRHVVAGYADGTIRWHRFTDGKELLAFFPHADRQRWIAWTPEGYFDASPGADDLIGYHLNRGRDQAGEFVSARQLWETFYQPDLIARRLDGDGDARVAEMVRQRGDIRQLLTVAPPELELLSPEQAESDGTYRLTFRVKQPGQGTGRVVLRVDGQELAGRWQAPALTPGGVVELPLELAEGTREVTAELIDGRGIGSKPVQARVQVRGQPNAEPATLYVLAVGVTNYRDGDLRRGVAFAAGDAVAIAGRLKERGALLPNFRGRVVTETLVDENATVAKIETTLKAMVTKTRPDDVFVFFMAGHGTTLDDEYYFMPWDLDYENDAALRRKGISQTLLREWQSRLPTRSLLLLDTCRAGSAMQLAARTGDDKNALAKLIRVSQRNVIVATSADRIALEGHEGHGVFSWAVLDALSYADYDDNGRVDVTDIATHVRKHVPAITEQKFKYRQVPMQDTPGEPFAVAVPEQRKE